ncbi:MAG: 50S ribosomal protein L18 [Patescibacteria group bacterium]|jgi:large subunit ribosomal protein L18
MSKGISKQLKRQRRKNRIRAKISGTKERPRLSVFKSNKGIYLQLIDDSIGKTLVSARVNELKAVKGMKKTDRGFELGKFLAAKAKEKGIEKIVFDRGGYKFHGRVKAVADGAKEGGLVF